MITEDYVSFEVAKLLKEKGFDGDSGDCECHMFYCEYTEERIMPICEIGFIPDNETVFFAPTHQMAMKWLREVHGLHIWVDCSRLDCDEKQPYLWNIVEIKIDGNYWGGTYHKTNEEAVEAALKYLLENLIL